MVFKRENISVVLVGFCMVLIGVIDWSSMYGGKRRPRNARTKWVCLTLKAENSCKRSLIKSGIFSPGSANSVGWEKSELPDLFWVFLFGLWWKCWTLSLTRAPRGAGVNPSERLGCTHRIPSSQPSLSWHFTLLHIQHRLCRSRCDLEHAGVQGKGQDRAWLLQDRESQCWGSQGQSPRVQRHLGTAWKLGMEDFSHVCTSQMCHFGSPAVLWSS